jgi:glycosyltransferase involved in cell wall biosynthesis
MSGLPVISIITVVLNRAKDIRYTLDSITKQDYPAIEYILIDGGSDDGTLAIIGEFKTGITKCISEPDHGIYDAMNKGLQMATGDYVLFINGGDALHEADTISKLASIIAHQELRPDIIYGECMFVDTDRKPLGTRSELRKNPLPKVLTFNSFELGSNVTHQCFLVRRSICDLYNLQYRLSSDIDWMLHCIKKSKSNINAGCIISDFVLGDATSKQYLRSMSERFRILKRHYGLLKALNAHLHMAFIRPFQ